MSEYREERTVVKDLPVSSRPVVETRYGSVEVKDVPVSTRPVETRYGSVEVKDVPVSSGPVAETRYDSVIDEPRGMSGGAVAALFVSVIAVAAIVLMLVIYNQQRNSDQDLAQERARTEAAQQTTPQTAQQQPVIVNVPPTQLPTMVPYPVPGPAQPPSVEAKAAPSSANVEADVTSRMQNDEMLRSYTIDVKVSGGTAVLSGFVPNEELKKRAETLTKSVNGVQKVMNDIAVRS